MMSRTGAQVIVDRLLCEGVRFAFGLCGHGNIGLLDALYDVQDRIQTISVHHEQPADSMADAYCRVLSRTAVNIQTTGPGLAALPTASPSPMIEPAAVLP